MKAMILNSYGDDARFEPTQLQTPQVKAGYVLVQVAATSVNTVDTMIRQLGQENLPLSPDLPALLGMDFAGVITQIGDGVEGFNIGDEVYGCAGGLADLPGALAEYMLADARLIAHKPKTLSMREAAAIPLVGITAYEGLTRAGTTTDQSVLVHGGAGGVGHIAVQVAKHFGARVHATGTGADQLAAIESFGATAIDFRQHNVADYVAEFTNGAGFEVIFDSVGGANMSNSFEAAALNAQIATTVSLLELDLTPAHFKGLSIHVIFMLIPMLHDHGRARHGDILAELSQIVDAGGLRPLLDTQAYDLNEVNEAYARLIGGQAMGKVVVTL
ncbi:MAG: zinc-dependent alcohol dehydrogenase family protein [Pseudomonadota bacterium]